MVVHGQSGGGSGGQSRPARNRERGNSRSEIRRMVEPGVEKLCSNSRHSVGAAWSQRESGAVDLDEHLRCGCGIRSDIDSTAAEFSQSGKSKAGSRLFDLFKNSPYARCWFVAGPGCG